MKKVVLVISVIAVYLAAHAGEVLNFVGSAFSAPTISGSGNVNSPSKGDIILDTSAGMFKGYDGTSWVNFNETASGGSQEVDSATSTSDITHSGPSSGDWYCPSNTFKVTVPSNGYYQVNLKAFQELLVSSSGAQGNQMTLEVDFGTGCTTNGTRFGRPLVVHREATTANSGYYSSFDYTSNEFYATTGTDIFVYISYRTFSGNPLMSSLKLRAESGTGNAMDPHLTLIKLRN